MEKGDESQSSQQGNVEGGDADAHTTVVYPAYEGKAGSCPICMDDKPDCADAGCGHLFCKACWNSFIETEFDKKRRSFLDLKCPADKCTRFLDDKAPAFMSDETLKNYEAVMKTIPPKRATCFQDFNYGYDKDGILRNTINQDKFHWVNQAHYDALGDYIVEHIQHLMKTDFGMEEILLPVGASESEPRCNIFLSPGALEKEKLILLIQGSGAVRPGQWARALCINDSLNMGSILPYLALCKERDWGVIVFNPNMNSVDKPGQPTSGLDPRSHEAFVSRAKIMPSRANTIPIKDNESPPQHCIYVWDQFGARSAAKDICIIAHSAGGPCTLALLNSRGKQLFPRLRGVAFTDSVHYISSRDSAQVVQFVQQNAVNWVRSDQPLDTPQSSSRNDCPAVSAGHEKHEYTSGVAINSVFKFLDNKMAQ